MQYNQIETEKEIAAFWEKNSIYEKAKSKNKGKKQFYFLDGPPYTSGKIHLGIAWNKVLKDSLLRYKRMQGFDVWDRAGYDMHGLPTELKVQAKLKIKYKDDIEKFGVAKFVEECRKFSLENLNVMNRDFKRLGVWMDFENAYKPIDQRFIEGEWWLIKKAHENKRLYEGEKVMHWCKNCATALAKHELEYDNVEEDSIFVKFKVRDKNDEYLIIWTTTPWTIPFNLGVMANPEIDYVKTKVGNETWIVAKALAGVLIGGVANKKFTISEEFKGEELEGLHYEHPFADIVDYKKLAKGDIHRVVLSTEYVDTGSGSGLVHMAPGCGPEDFEVGKKNNIEPFNNLDEYGVFPAEMGKFGGLTAKKDDRKFVEELEKKGVLIATTKVEHDYAFCWRCKEPVIFRTTKQWFFRTEDLKGKMRELNKKVKWVPDWAGARQFDSWLNNLRDNSITRQRYWGTPVPIWKCSKCSEFKVIGSVEELKKLSGNAPADLHKPYIDEVTIKCRCGSVMHRIPDILDVWIDAGTTSWTCLDYPQKKELFEKLYPPEFILEGKDQIRGWFNLLFVASMVSMNKPAYKSVYMHGFINDALGRKMSKSLGNIISPYEAIDKYGADVLRYYMIGGANPGIDINYNFEDMKTSQKNLMILWNLHNYLIDFSKELNAKPGKINADDIKKGIEEKYILSKLNSTIKKVTELMDSYMINEVPLHVQELFLELSRTYVQLVREKAAVGEEKERKTVLYVIYKVLIETLKMFSVVAPFIIEKIYQNLRDEFGLEEESISLFSWPKHDEAMIDYKLGEDVERLKLVVQAALFAREKANLGVRWPISELLVVTKDKETKNAVEKLKAIIRTQCNVKDIEARERFLKVTETVKPDFSKIGPDFGTKAPKIVAKLIGENTKTVMAHLEKDGVHRIKVDDEVVDIVKEYLIVERKVPADYKEAEFRHGFVYISTKLTKELEAEGFAREVMRRVQALRKDAKLKKTDRINAVIFADSEFIKMLSKFAKQITEKVGADELTLTDKKPEGEFKFSSKEKVKDREFEVLF